MQGFKRVYIIHNTAAYSEKNADYFMREAQHLSVTVVGIWATDLKENFAAVIRRMTDASPDLVYFATRVDQAGAFFTEARAAGYMGAFLGTDGVNRPALAELAGLALIEGDGTYYTDMVAPASYYADARQFLFDFDESYTSPPRNYAVQAYDATGICLKAIEEASKAKGGELPSRKEVANAIRALQDFKGISGTYTFNNKGDPAPAMYYIFKVDSADPGNWDRNPVVVTFDVEPPR
jgi:branched-chain amino acid transport system substrate-binding protein